MSITSLFLIMFLKNRILKKRKRVTVDAEVVDEIIKKSGYAFDERQGIFYSNRDAWQRKYGYCRMYDDMLAATGMILHAEPIYFTYNNKDWLVEIWKGQYDLSMGCEMGFYVTNGEIIDIPNKFNGKLYKAVPDEEMIDMKFILKKKGQELFKREEKHWWLTGFRVGEYVEPEDLTMEVSLRFKDKPICDAFVSALDKLGYEYIQRDRRVDFTFDVPKTKQPIYQTGKVRNLIQKKNKLLCDSYQKFMKIFGRGRDKMKTMGKVNPELYDKLFLIGKTKSILEKIDYYFLEQ